MFYKKYFDYIPYVSRAEKKDIERLFKRVFRSDDGQKALTYLQYITFHRTLNATSTEEQLRHQEGERSLVRKIMQLADL